MEYILLPHDESSFWHSTDSICMLIYVENPISDGDEWGLSKLPINVFLRNVVYNHQIVETKEEKIFFQRFNELENEMNKHLKYKFTEWKEVASRARDESAATVLEEITPSLFEKGITGNRMLAFICILRFMVKNVVEQMENLEKKYSSREKLLESAFNCLNGYLLNASLMSREARNNFNICVLHAKPTRREFCIIL